MPKIQEIPWAGVRVETGPIRFGTDWAGVFLRGDQALPYSVVLRRLLNGGAIHSHDRSLLEGLATELGSCDERGLTKGGRE
ncbi:MAG: hypothetical protein OEY69_00080 [Candidatus Krumholzibacteria bacterium]|nr:hypothetical protein [Candidatus Krumholzibacteria bacterium]